MKMNTYNDSTQKPQTNYRVSYMYRKSQSINQRNNWEQLNQTKETINNKYKKLKLAIYNCQNRNRN